MAKRAVRRKKAVVEETNTTRIYLIYGSIALVALFLLGLLIYSLREPEGIADLVIVPGVDRGHDNSLVYEPAAAPRLGGPHHDAWLNCGVYNEPVTEANVLHSLEHGAIWLTYNESLPSDEVAALEAYGRDLSYIIVSPYPSQEDPVVLTGWGVQLSVDDVDDRRVDTFIERYRQGPQTPERGAACTGGVGVPVG